MHNPEFVLENEMHKLLWDFEIQTDHQFSARLPDPLIINKKRENLPNSELCCPSGPQSKIEWMRKGELVPRPWLGIEITVEYESDGYTNCNWCSWYSHQMIGTRLEELGNNGMGGDSKLQHCWDRPKYWEVSWRLEDACCHSNSWGKLSTNADVKNSQGENNYCNTNKWYMHSTESILENEKQKFLWDFEIQTNHLISAGWPDLVIINKKKLLNCELCCPGWPLSKIERKEKKDN